MARANADPDNNPIEFKGRMVTVTVARLRGGDVARLLAAVDRRMETAPAMFRGMPLALDLDALESVPGDAELQQLIAGLRERGLAPVAVTGQKGDPAALAARLGLGMMHPGATAASDPPPPRPVEASAPAPTTRIVTQPVRSGQQVYARGGDLVVLAAVSPGAELLADGCVHVYGALNGRALAGVQGDRTARIFCRELNAQLVAIAGHYQISENIEEGDRGRGVQIFLQGDALAIQPLEAGG